MFHYASQNLTDERLCMSVYVILLMVGFVATFVSLLGGEVQVELVYRLAPVATPMT